MFGEQQFKRFMYWLLRLRLSETKNYLTTVYLTTSET